MRRLNHPNLRMAAIALAGLTGIFLLGKLLIPVSEMTNLVPPALTTNAQTSEPSAINLPPPRDTAIASDPSSIANPDPQPTDPAPTPLEISSPSSLRPPTPSRVANPTPLPPSPSSLLAGLQVRLAEIPLPEMVAVKGGSFQMGCNDARDGNCQNREVPEVEVILSDFAIGKYEVKVGEYLQFCLAVNKHFPEWLEPGNVYHLETGKNAFYRNQGYDLNNLDLPISGITWNDALAYCAWLSQKTGKRFRLPTAAEWEYAARGGQRSKGTRYSGSNSLEAVAWFDGNSKGRTHPAGRRAANELGLYDLNGNVWEWCADWFDEDYYSQLAGQRPVNPKGPDHGVNRLCRGGGIYDLAGACRVATRSGDKPDYRSDDLGFRLAGN